MPDIALYSRNLPQLSSLWVICPAKDTRLFIRDTRLLFATDDVRRYSILLSSAITEYKSTPLGGYLVCLNQADLLPTSEAADLGYAILQKHGDCQRSRDGSVQTLSSARITLSECGKRFGGVQ
ncbi:hypothetical protein ACNKHK_15185 [Shigella flexneri]